MDSSMVELFADQPVTDPKDDMLGYSDFAKLVAKGIVEMTPPEGLVISVNGGWGSGKTSVLNFIEYYVKHLTKETSPVVIRFNPWWFPGHESLIKNFFSLLELNLASGKLRIRSLRKRVAQLSDLVSKVPVQHAGIFKIISDLTGVKDRDVLSLKQDISSLLLKQKTRILLIVDDIDRLTALEMSQLFRVIKAVADFPNITYLLAFDKAVVSEALTKTYDIPGNDYLEKIIQVPFDMPHLNKESLRRVLFTNLDVILHDTPQALFDSTHWANVFLSGMESFLNTPRDVVRLINTLNVTYRGLVGEVNAVDFVAIEMLRVMVPAVYAVIRDQSSYFTGSSNSRSSNQSEFRNFHDRYIEELPPNQREPMRKLLTRLFPRLESVWGNMSYGTEWELTWRKKRRICSSDVIGYYLRWSVPDDTLSNREMQQILGKATSRAAISEEFISLINTVKANGRTKFRDFIERVEDYTDSLSEEQSTVIIETLFDIGDKLISPLDESSTGMFDFGIDTRIGRVIWQLLRHFPEQQRFELIKSSICTANSVYIPVREVAILGQEHGKNGSSDAKPEDNRMVSTEHLNYLEEVALNKIRKSAEAEQLLGIPHLVSVLYRWREWESEQTVRNWVKLVTATDDKLVKFLTEFLQYTHIQSLNDAAGRRVPRVSITSVEHFVDMETVIPRVKALDIDDDGWSETEKIALRELLRVYEVRKSGGDPDDF